MVKLLVMAVGRLSLEVWCGFTKVVEEAHEGQQLFGCIARAITSYKLTLGWA